MLMLILAIVVSIAALATAAAYYGSLRWKSGTREIRSKLEATCRPTRPKRIDLEEVEGLPKPVRTYFRKVLTNGRPPVAGVSVKHTGTFNMGEGTDRWKPFVSDQTVVIHPPGFDWDGAIHVGPGLKVCVHDAYVAGEGLLHASLLGLVPLTKVRDTDELAAGELMRFLAEAAWYPTALLPSEGVKWEAVDDHSAQAVLVDGHLTSTMLFTFGEQGLIETVRASARPRMVGGRYVPTPWSGRFWNYEKRAGMLIPLGGEVAWVLPEGPKPYWRGHISEIAYEFEPS